MLQDTIAAISTAAQDGAISIIRISGEEAIPIADALLDRSLKEKDSHTVTYGHIIDPLTKEAVDEVLVSLFRAPRTYTREDIVEISCHGGRFITRQILQLVLAQGARLARPGEFTQRAFLSGRIDLTQAEAVNDMIQANTKENVQLAMAGIRGSVRKLLDPLIEALLDMIANIEVNIDYPEYEDIEEITQEKLLPKARAWIREIEGILQRADSGQIIREGIQTAIIGRPNVGKSSLLNALLEEEKAIVTDIAGTTRDTVEETLCLGGLVLRLQDTAGLRETNDPVEKIGVSRARDAVRTAAESGVVLAVFDGSKPVGGEDRMVMREAKNAARAVAILNKADLPRADGWEELSDCFRAVVPLSAKHREGLSELTDTLLTLTGVRDLPSDGGLITNIRQAETLKRSAERLELAAEHLKAGFSPDAVVYDIEGAIESLGELTGQSVQNDIVDHIFANFCVGK